MTTVRDPNSLKYVARRFIDVLGAGDCATLLGVTEATIYALSNPDKANHQLNVRQALVLDGAVARLRGDSSETPFLEWARAQVDLIAASPAIMPASSITSEMLDVVAAGGELAQKIRNAIDENSPGGSGLTVHERADIAKTAEELVQQAKDVKRAVAVGYQRKRGAK